MVENIFDCFRLVFRFPKGLVSVFENAVKIQLKLRESVEHNIAVTNVWSYTAGKIAINSLRVGIFYKLRFVSLAVLQTKISEVMFHRMAMVCRNLAKDISDWTKKKILNFRIMMSKYFLMPCVVGLVTRRFD